MIEYYYVSSHLRGFDLRLDHSCLFTFLTTTMKSHTVSHESGAAEQDKPKLSPNFGLGSKLHSYDQCAWVDCMNQRTAQDTRLPLCSGCRCARYCSLEHQRNDWENHKPDCKRHQEAISLLSSLPNADQKGTKDLYPLLTSWIHKHMPTLSDALVSSLDLPSHPQRQRDWGLHLSVRYRAGQPAPLAFEIERVMECNLDFMRRRFEGYEELLNKRRQYEERSLQTDWWSYGAGVVFLNVFLPGERRPIITRMLPITFSNSQANSVPSISWREELFMKINLGIVEKWQPVEE
ncbi:unnamed protein product [Somion occarium]|uniref:MYND-type domain-containing protein n=1 Tax=Somion occarium TaxID=3059160 RepID=A0ABP1DUR8_9APHY